LGGRGFQHEARSVMTELDWLTSKDVWSMSAFLLKTAGKRKLRLFGCACCRRVWDYLTLPEQRTGVEVAERYAEGLALDEELYRAHEALSSYPLYRTPPSYVTSEEMDVLADTSTAAVRLLEDHAGNDWARKERAARIAAEWDAYVKLMHDLVGPLPFRPITLDPRWLTSSVQDLAKLINEERRFELMPVLGDALMDAGCDDEDVVYHCQSEPPHALGCWVLDLLMGK
jgi:acetyl esterase/lipase